MDARIPLTQGKETVIDAADLPAVAAHRWHAVYQARARRWHAAGFVGGRPVSLHRFLLDAGPDIVVSHVNGDGPGDRRANLRRRRKAKRRRH